MQTVIVYLIFWLPPGFQFDPSVPNGIGNYETLLTDFFNDVAPSTYYIIVGQYTGTCGSNACSVQNAPNALHVGGTFLDTRGYAHANGNAADVSETDPLLDADIQHEVQSLISQFGLSDGVNTEFFVYLGNGYTYVCMTRQHTQVRRALLQIFARFTAISLIPTATTSF